MVLENKYFTLHCIVMYFMTIGEHIDATLFRKIHYSSIKY